MKSITPVTKINVRGIRNFIYRRILFFVLILSFAYSFLFSFLSIYRLYSFGSHYYDLGIMHQVVLNTSKGHFLEFTNPHLVENTNRLAIHFDPILALFAPLYWFFPYAEVLLVIQSLFLALSGIIIFKIARLVLKDDLLSFLCSALFYLYYPLQYINLFDFHPVSLSIFFLLFGIYEFLKNDFKLNKKILLSLFLASLTKENIILVVALVFFWAYIKSRQRIFLFLSGFFGVYLVAVLKLIIPYFSGGEHFGLKYYSFSFTENIRRFLSESTWRYFYSIFFPLLFIPLLCFSCLIPFLPEFFKNALSSNANMRNLYFHYLSGSLPFIFLGLIFGLRRFKKNAFKIIIIIFLLIFNFYLTLHKGPLSYFFKKYKLDRDKLSYVFSLRERYDKYELPLSSTGQLAPFFSGRRYFYDFLYDPAFSSVGIKKDDIIKQSDKYKKAAAVIVHLPEVRTGLAKELYLRLKNDPSFTLKEKKFEIEIYERQR